MNPRLPLLAALVAALFIPASVSAQKTELRPLPQGTPDQVWEQLKSGKAARSDHEAATDPAAAKQARAEQAARRLQEADEAKSFHALNPTHARAKDARLAEVQGLIAAANLGLTEVEGRLESTVALARQDQGLPKPLRAEIAGLFEFSRAIRRNRDTAARLVALDRAARVIMAEFPDQPQGYQTLLNVGRVSDDSRYRDILFELSQSRAPGPVKDEVRGLLARHFLAGERLPQLLRDGLAEAALDSLKAGKATVVYTWSPDDPGSIALAEQLERLAPLAANFIGLCLAPDSETNRETARAKRLPGFHYYHTRGAGSPLAIRLQMRRPGAVLLADAQGIVRDTRGESAPADKLAGLGR